MNIKPPCLCSILLIINYLYHLIRPSNLTTKFKMSAQLDSQIYSILHVASPTFLANSHYIHFHIYGINGLVWFWTIRLEHRPSANLKHFSWMPTIAPLNAPMLIVMTVAQSKCYILYFIYLIDVYHVILLCVFVFYVLCYRFMILSWF